MFYEEIRIKQSVSYILFCPLRILYNSKFIIMATFLGTNAIVVMWVHCICSSYLVLLCFRKAVLRDCGISWVSIYIFDIMKTRLVKYTEKLTAIYVFEQK